MKKELNAANFIQSVEDLEGLTKYERQTLLKDMPDILDKMNWNGPAGNKITVKQEFNDFEVSNKNYVRNYYADNLCLREENYLVNGNPQSVGDKPATVRYWPDSDKISQKIWSDKGINIRADDKPAVVSYHINGNLSSETWEVKGKAHREGDKPALIMYYPSGKVQSEHWYKDNTPARDGEKPIIIRYDESGKITESITLKDYIS